MGRLVTRGPKNLKFWSGIFDYWTKTSTTVTDNNIEAPWGETVGALLESTGAAGQRIDRSGNVNGGYYDLCLSLYGRAGTLDNIGILLRDNTAGVNAAWVEFTLSTGAITSINAGNGGFIEDEGTWKRFYVYNTALRFTPFCDLRPYIYIDPAGSGAGNIYVANVQINQGTIPDPRLITNEVPIT